MSTMMEPSEISRDLSPTPETTISIPTPPLSSPQLAPVDKIKEESKISTPKKSSFADMASKIQSKFHYGSSSNATGGIFTANPEYSDNPETSSMENVLVSIPHSKPDYPPRTLSPRHYKNIAEDYMSYDPPVDSRKASTVYSAPIRRMFPLERSRMTFNETYFRDISNVSDGFRYFASGASPTSQKRG